MKPRLVAAASANAIIDATHRQLVCGATIAGHVTVEEWAVVGALCPVHQFVRIGAHSYVGGGTTITQDVLPFSMTSAARETHAYGMNKVGLERRGFSKERIAKIHHAYKILLASKMNTSQALAKLKAEKDPGEDVEMLVRFIEGAERGGSAGCRPVGIGTCRGTPPRQPEAVNARAAHCIDSPRDQ